MASKKTLEALGEAILLSSISFSIASVEQSSKFSVKNFSKDQETLQNAADALIDYMKIGVLWAGGCMMVMYAKYGNEGLLYSTVMNAVILAWVYISYKKAFQSAADKYGLVMPNLNFY
jgi:hypothetical protein